MTAKLDWPFLPTDVVRLSDYKPPRGRRLRLRDGMLVRDLKREVIIAHVRKGRIRIERDGVVIPWKEPPKRQPRAEARRAALHDVPHAVHQRRAAQPHVRQVQALRRGQPVRSVAYHR